jgi:hypothetical protein
LPGFVRRIQISPRLTYEQVFILNHLNNACSNVHATHIPETTLSGQGHEYFGTSLIVIFFDLFIVHLNSSILLFVIQNFEYRLSSLLALLSGKHCLFVKVKSCIAISGELNVTLFRFFKIAIDFELGTLSFTVYG